jgi:hypothetical protein
MLRIEMESAARLRCTTHTLHQTEDRMRQFRSCPVVLFSLKGCRVHVLCVKSQSQ